ncbi:hypothetical protein Plim_1617 [Planctopirus limnophila DSM 3776]|uniref:Uncharacterized protein n=1 Tax=Planctopirus limnophila (strain ATCC 43296 / DSM 3776 / IFAM 1008 / Mu 290) TaxID=521674 RepID=D5SWU9_PLAL2|nr:hypothetical protein Plim_1617 [Planctopirus limnophila DSM 3776]
MIWKLTRKAQDGYAIRRALPRNVMKNDLLIWFLPAVMLGTQ